MNIEIISTKMIFSINDDFTGSDIERDIIESTQSRVNEEFDHDAGHDIVSLTKKILREEVDKNRIEILNALLSSKNKIAVEGY